MAKSTKQQTDAAPEPYTLERVRSSFERLVTTMDAHSSKTLYHADWFISECLNVAAEYIDKLDVNSRGFRIASHELYLIPKTENGQRVISVRKLVANELVPYPIASIARDLGGNKFAEILCGALDKMSLEYESITKDDNYIPHYMESLNKAKTAIHVNVPA